MLLEKACPETALICEAINYTLTVTNRGDAAANNVKIVDNLPAGVTSDGKSSVSFNIGTLPPGQSKKVQFSATASKPGKFTNTAEATADGGLVSKASCTTTVREPSLVVTKKGPGMRLIGRPAEYEITVSNKGDAASTNTVLVDTFTGPAQFVSASDGGQFADGKVTWNLGTIAPNASKKVTVTLKATDRGEIKNTASVRGVCSTADTQVLTDVKGIPAILLEVIDVDDPDEVGTEETYVITVTNQGSADGTGIVIECTLPQQQEFVRAQAPTKHSVSGKTVRFDPLPELDPKASVVYKVTVKGIETGDVRFRVKMTSDQLTSPVEETESTNIY